MRQTGQTYTARTTRRCILSLANSKYHMTGNIEEAFDYFADWEGRSIYMSGIDIWDGATPLKPQTHSAQTETPEPDTDKRGLSATQEPHTSFFIDDSLPPNL